jgi:hypothetical protein
LIAQVQPCLCDSMHLTNDDISCGVLVLFVEKDSSRRNPRVGN